MSILNTNLIYMYIIFILAYDSDDSDNELPDFVDEQEVDAEKEFGKGQFICIILSNFSMCVHRSVVIEICFTVTHLRYQHSALTSHYS